MATRFQVSPGVDVNELDLTGYIPAVSTSIGAYAGMFAWGPSGDVQLITSERDLINTYGKPNNDNFVYWFSAATYLYYSNALKVNRALPAAARNANSGGDTSLIIKNTAEYDAYVPSSPNSIGSFAAKYPGALGNSLKVAWCLADDSSPNSYDTWTYKNQFLGAPNTSPYAENVGGVNDEIHVLVIDEDGAWTGVAGTVLERWQFLSLASDAKNQEGGDNYYATVLNNQSKYVWWIEHPADLVEANAGSTAAGTTFYSDPTTATGSSSLSGGEDGTSLTLAEQQSGYTPYIYNDATDISILIGGVTPNVSPGDEITYANYIVNIAETRKDCVATISPPLSLTVGIASPLNALTLFAQSLTSSSYGILDSSAIKIYDRYNDVYRWIPASGSVAGILAHTDDIADPWFSPGGHTRGQFKNIAKLAYNPYDRGDRDELYRNRINPIVQFPGEGTLLYGDKTLLSKPSAFDRINVRRLFIVLEKAISTAAKYQLFEFNDDFTRAQFRNMVEPYLREVQGRRGLTAFQVVCDTSNNTAEVIDGNEFVADIYIKPSRSINFITLNFIATRTGVDFAEIIGQRG